MLYRAKTRAKRKGIPFDLKPEDIHLPEFCPVSGVRLEVGAGDNAPSLDRIVPALGYVRGNVVVIATRVNRLKSDATPEELNAIAEWLSTILPKGPDQ